MDDAQMKKNGIRMKMDIYSIIFPFLKTGLTPSEIETQMTKNLGYSYKGKYADGGFSSLVDLLNSHDKIIQMNNGRYTVKCTKETEDIAQLIVKQKTTTKKKSRGTFRSNSPKNFQYRTINAKSKGSYNYHKNTKPPMTTMQNCIDKKKLLLVVGAKSPTKKAEVSASHPVKPKVTPVVESGKKESAPAVAPRENISSLTEVTPEKPQENRHVMSKFPDTKDEPVRIARKNEIPPIEEFKKQVYRMLVEIYPKTIQLSDMNSFYYRRFGCHVNPVACYSKTWLFLSKTLFRDFMEVRNENVQLIDSVSRSIKDDPSVLPDLAQKLPKNSSTPPPRRTINFTVFERLSGMKMLNGSNVSVRASKNEEFNSRNTYNTNYSYSESSSYGRKTQSNPSYRDTYYQRNHEKIRYDEEEFELSYKENRHQKVKSSYDDVFYVNADKQQFFSDRYMNNRDVQQRNYNCNIAHPSSSSTNQKSLLTSGSSQVDDEDELSQLSEDEVSKLLREVQDCYIDDDPF